ncbi:MAG TPA: tetratricopeptide repeat protein, partial [Saprospiraceae bacterium]|nr:tetratricopeptide repeat protein [Saprospiraceae bacterium]
MTIRTAIVLIVFHLTLCLSLAAQTGGDPHRYDLRIERFYEKNQRDSFLFYTNEKLRLARQADDLALWGWTQIDVHDFFSDHGNNDEALKILDAAWQQRWREPKNPEEWEPFLYVQQNRGWCLFEAGKIWQAVQAYESAAQLYERFRYPDFEAVEMIYKPLGAHYTRLGDNEKALVVLEKAKAIGGDNETMAGLYNNVGLAYWNQGDPAQACVFFRTGLDLGNISLVKRASLLAGLAQATLDVQWDNTESEKQEVSKAFGIANQALALLRSVSTADPEYLQYRADARRTAGLAAIKFGRYDEAWRLLADALTDAKKVYGSVSRDVGKIEVARSALLQKQGKFPAAIEAANRALQAVLPDYKPKNSKENPGLGSYYEENVIFEALEAKALAAELLSQQNTDPAWLTLALECHDLAWQAEMRLRNVHQYSSSKLDLQKNARIREESAMRVARLLYEKTGQARYIEKAFAIAERSKATLLLEALHDNLVRQGAAGKDDRFGQIDGLRRSLAYFERSLLLEPSNTKAPQWRIEADAIGSEITRLERELAAAYPRLANPITTTGEAMPGPDDLATGEALVTYFVRGNTIDIIVLQKDKPATWYTLPNNDELKTLVDRFFSFFNNSAAILNAPGAYLETAFALWQKIVPA